jgi:hypothetical protein
MSFTMNITQSATEGSTSITATTTDSVEVLTKVTKDVTAGVTDTVDFSLEVLYVQSFIMTAEVALTFVAYDTASTPAAIDTVTVAPGLPIVFRAGDSSTLLGTDWSYFTVQNAGTEDGNLNIMVGSNTP